MISEQEIKNVFATAEKAYEDCWTLLTDLQDAKALFAFQATLIMALYRIELFYRKVCDTERTLISQKHETDKKKFSECMETLARYKQLLDQLAVIEPATKLRHSQQTAFEWRGFFTRLTRDIRCRTG